jgi:predicted O-methyltransferase YrrM
MSNVKNPNNCNCAIQITAEDFTLFGDPQTHSVAEERMLTAVAATGGLVIPAEALVLYRISQHLTSGARVLEMGSYLGASTVALGHSILNRGIELYCIDPWRDYQTQGFFDHTLAGTTTTDKDIFARFQFNTSFLGEQLRILKGTTEQFRHFLPSGFFDLIFIDAAHDYESVKQDVLMACKAIMPGGIMCGHDYHSDGAGVVQAVNELIADTAQFSSKGLIPGTSIWYAIPQFEDPNHAQL